MTREANIFFNVVTSENSMTELLCNYMAYKPLRDIMLKLIGVDDNDINTINYSEFDTQYTLPDNSRPDMRVANDDIEILIEVKTGDAHLTGNQPTSYLEYLLTLDKREKILVLLAPGGYDHEADWDRAVNEFRCKNTSLDIKTKIVYWQAVIKSIEKNDLNILSERVNDYYFLIKQWFEIEKISFTYAEVGYMYSAEIGKIHQKLTKIVDEVRNYNAKHFTVRHIANSSEYGLYFRDSEGQDILYIGIWYEFWSRYGCPICFGLNPADSKKEIVQKFMATHKKDCKELDGYQVCCIDKTIYEKDDCAEIISKMIHQELKELGGLSE